VPHTSCLIERSDPDARRPFASTTASSSRLLSKDSPGLLDKHKELIYCYNFQSRGEEEEDSGKVVKTSGGTVRVG
jgi:hypothetical protein